MTSINIDEWLAELQKLSDENKDGLRVTEIAKAKGWGPKKTYAVLHEANEAGWLRRGTKWISQLNGVRRKVECYWFEKPKGKK